MTKKRKHFKELKNWHNTAIPIIEKFGTKPLFDHPKKFVEFWQAYGEAYYDDKNKKFDFKNKNFKLQARKRFLDLVNRQKKKRQTSVELHENYIKFHIETKVSQRTKKKEQAAVVNENDNLEIITKKVEKKKITEIAFASDITVATVNRISNETKFLEEFAADYIEQIRQNNSLILHNSHYGEKTASSLQPQGFKPLFNGQNQDQNLENQEASEACGSKLGERQAASGDFESSIDDNGYQKKGVANSPRVKRLEGSYPGGVGGGVPSQRKSFHFQHLALSNKFRAKFEEIADDLSNKILECNPRELADINKRIDAIMKLIDASRKIDLQPVYMLNQIAEGGFNRQKELQGAVVNDKSMIDNGQIVLEKVKEEEQVTSEDIKKDLKTLGSALLLETAAQFADEANTIEQEESIKDAEFEEDYEK